MNDSDSLSQLRRLPFFGDLTDEMLEPLAPVSRVVEYPAGALLFRQGESARAGYFVLEGTVALELCASAVGCKRLMTVEAGELLGWSPVLEQERLTATARALSPIRAIEIDGAQMMDLCRANPQLGYELMKRTALALAKRLNATRLQLLNVYGDDIPSVPDERPRA